MADTKYPGHDEGSVMPPTKPTGYSSPATHAPLTQDPQGVNQKTDLGKTGKS